MKLQLPKLPFGHAELEPFQSSEQLDTHYYKHHKAYIEQVNLLSEEMNLKTPTLEYIIHNHDGKLFNNAAQAWNHTFFWMGLAPMSAGPNTGGPLMAAIQKKYGSVDGLRERFVDAAASVFGSGWTWLVATPDGELDIVNTSNADNPMRLERVRPIWTCDVWEHAYYIDYKNDRKEYLKRSWRHVNWDFVERNFTTEEIPNMTRLMISSDAPSPNPQA